MSSDNSNNSSIRPRIRSRNVQFLNDDEPIQSTPRLKTTYAEFLKIKQDIAKRLGSQLAVAYDFAEGVICNTCDSDDTLNGHFTRNKPVKSFDYTRLRRHLSTSKHRNRCTEEERKMIDEADGKLSSPVHLSTELDSILNVFDLLTQRLQIWIRI